MRIFSTLFVPNRMWLRPRPPMTNPNEKSINRWDAMLSVPRPPEARQWWRFFPNLIVFIDMTSDKDEKKKTHVNNFDGIPSTDFLYSNDALPTQAYLVGSKSNDENGFSTKRKWKWTREKNMHKKSVFLFDKFIFILSWRLAWLMFVGCCDGVKAVSIAHINIYEVKFCVQCSCQSNKVSVVNGNAFEIEPTLSRDPTVIRNIEREQCSSDEWKKSKHRHR